MNHKKRATGIYLPILFITMLVSCALRTAAALTDFNPRTGYFEGKALITAAGIIAAASAILLFTYVFVAPKGRKLIASFSSPAMYIPSGIVCVALVFFAVECRTVSKELAAHPLAQAKTSELILSALALLSLLSIVYFVLNAMITERASIKRAGFGIFAVILMTLYAAFLYFDTTLPLNAPNKIVDQMAYLFIAVFMLYEIRISLGRECWNLYTGFGFIAAILSAYSSVPSVIAYFIKGTTLSHSIYESALTLCLCIFVVCRVISAENLYEDKESELVTMIKAYSDEREAILEHNREIEREAYLEILNVMQSTEEEEAEPIESEVFATEESDIDREPIVEEAESSGEENAEGSKPSPVEEDEQGEDNAEQASGDAQSDETQANTIEEGQE